MNKSAVIASGCIPLVTSVIGISEAIKPSLETAVPGFDHVSSVAGSYSAAAIVIVVSECIADKLDVHGRSRSAEKVRKYQTASAWLGSIATQAICESGYIPAMGVSDYKDVLFGLAATIPGVVAGRALRKWTNSNETNDL